MLIAAPFLLALLVLSLPFLLALFVLSLRFVLPFVERAEARTEQRKRAAIDRQRCDWCMTPLSVDALARADTLFAAYVAKIDRENDTLRHRLVRDVHACCPSCDACYGYDELAERFVPLHARTARTMYADLLEPATAAMAWPWLGPHAPLHAIVLTLDSVFPTDAVHPPFSAMVEVLATADVGAIAETLLRSPWLADAGSDSAWRYAAGSVTLVFGLRAGMPFVTRIGDDTVRTDQIAAIHLWYEAQHDIADA